MRLKIGAVLRIGRRKVRLRRSRLTLLAAALALPAACVGAAENGSAQNWVSHLDYGKHRSRQFTDSNDR